MDFHIAQGNAVPLHAMKYHSSACTASTHSGYFDAGEYTSSRPDCFVPLRTRCTGD